MSFTSSLVLAVVGSAVTSLSNPFYINAPALLTATWFGQSSVRDNYNQRTSATTVAAAANTVGGAIGFMIPVWVVRSGELFDHHQVTMLMMLEAILASFALLLVILFFRNGPSSSPSASSSPPAAPFWASLKALSKDNNYKLLVLAFFCANGALNTLEIVIEEIFAIAGVPEPASVASLGTCVLLACGLPGSLIFGALADRTSRFKFLLSLSTIGSGILFLALTFTIPMQTPSLIILLMGAVGFVNLAGIPLALELEA